MKERKLIELSKLLEDQPAYAEVNGLMLPQRVRTENEMSGATVIEWTNSEFDTVDPETFDIAITR